MNAMHKAALLISLFVGPCSANASNDVCDGLLPASVHTLLHKRYAGWKILMIPDLVQDDQNLWRRYHKDACPGFARLTSTTPGQYAVLLILILPKVRSAELVLVQKRRAKWESLVLHQETKVGNFPVVYRAASGNYRDLVSGKDIHVTSNAAIYEHIEASALLFYEERNRYRHAVIAE